MSHTHGITPDLVEAYGLCRRKAFLLLHGDAGDPPHDYVSLLDAYGSSSLDTFVRSLQASGLIVQRHPNPELNGKADVLTHVPLKTEHLEAVAHVLVRSDPVSSKARHYEPHLVVGTHSVTREQKTKLAFLGHLLAETHRHRPSTGVIVDAAGGLQRIHLSKLMANLTPVLETLKEWRTTLPSDPPPVLLNDHCPICPFRESCLQQAERDDSLTLLDRMTPKVMRKYHQRGIFSVNQLSFLFRPRRQRKRRRNRPTGFKLELQALALRTGKTYLHEPPSVLDHPTEIFLDMEGVPDQGSYYLIGLLVCAGGRIEPHSLWADSLEEEGNIFRAMLRIAQDHPDAPIYHYGSFEPRGLDRIAKRIGLAWDTVKGRLVNVNSLIFGKVYFPARSNTLKALGRLVGATWTSPDASGLQSVVWRLQWELSKDDALKDHLLTYNLEDCHALRLLVAELRNIGQAAATRSDVDYADAPKQNTTDRGKDIHDTLEGILKSAHAEYKKNRIGIRAAEEGIEEEPRKRGAPKGHFAYKRIAPTKAGRMVQVRRPMTCPNHQRHNGRALEASDKVAEHILIDLAFTRAGCRKTVTKYTGRMGFCPRCKQHYAPPAIRRLKGRLFGHKFRAWTVYQRIVLRLPYRIISQVIYDLFREQVSGGSLIRFIADLARYYAVTERTMLTRILASPFIHVDETKLNIQGVDHYVWVLTDGLHVVFRLTETREPTLVQQMLDGYAGVLVSDFYGGYDACNCRQQKCLVHLIRDLNDDLWKNPFNEELEGFVSAVRDLLVPIMADVERFGLKRWHLHKHTHLVERFYKAVIVGREYKCEVTEKYQKRFIRYKESLFRFLEEDSIPWNNNTAERASRHLAVQRKISGSFFKRVAVQYLLLLGIAQTCRFQGKSFLNFLTSQEKNIDEFKEKKRPKVTIQVPSARSNPETASDTAGEEAVGEDGAGEIEKIELDQGLRKELPPGSSQKG
jgi:predicted RecB family nuclease